MLFNSVDFVIFFIFVTPAYFILPHRLRWLLLLGASCYFYMAFVPVYILILVFTIVVDYFAALLLEAARGRRRQFWLVSSIVANVGVLAAFKYYSFLTVTLADAIEMCGLHPAIPSFHILLPIGLSFHTFQAMSYTIEVYRGRQKAERHFGRYALFVMFYPQLVAGPIERPQNLLHQFLDRHEFSFTRIISGLKFVVYGLFLKLVVADRLAIFVNAAYNNVNQHTGLTLAVATLFFAFQIYCDFAGYSNIAIGAAEVMGFSLMTNFRRPYFAQSISDFWSRWHISLSTWFRDYLYIPLGGNRVARARWYRNLMIVFAVSGLWHGANCTFVIWGALNGIYLIFGVVSNEWRNRLAHHIRLDRMPRFHAKMKSVTTVLLCCVAWVFFRSSDSATALAILGKIARLEGPLYMDFATMCYSCIGLITLLAIESRGERLNLEKSPLAYNHWLQESVAYACLLLAILILGVFDGGQFIYFQF